MNKKFDEAKKIFNQEIEMKGLNQIIPILKESKETDRNENNLNELLEDDLYKFLELRGWKYNEGEWINDEIPF